MKLVPLGHLSSKIEPENIYIHETAVADTVKRCCAVSTAFLSRSFVVLFYYTTTKLLLLLLKLFFYLSHDNLHI